LEVLGHSLLECEEAGIPVVGIGLGLAPVHLPQLFPVALHSPRSADLGVALSVALEVAHVGTENKILPAILSSQMELEKMKTLLQRISDSKSVINKRLAESIRDKLVSIDMCESFGNTKLLFMKHRSEVNPTIEPYDEGAFAGFRILIVCLYLGVPGTSDEKITQEVFHSGCGKSLKRKGLVL
jgi:hypothetical protein